MIKVGSPLTLITLEIIVWTLEKGISISISGEVRSYRGANSTCSPDLDLGGSQSVLLQVPDDQIGAQSDICLHFVKLLK